MAWSTPTWRTSHAGERRSAAADDRRRARLGDRLRRRQARLLPGRAARTAPGTILVLVPTAASVTAFTSSLAVLLVDGVKRTRPSRFPDAVVCDLETLAAAPPAMTGPAWAIAWRGSSRTATGTSRTSLAWSIGTARRRWR